MTYCVCIKKRHSQEGMNRNGQYYFSKQCNNDNDSHKIHSFIHGRNNIRKTIKNHRPLRSGPSHRLWYRPLAISDSLSSGFEEDEIGP